MNPELESRLSTLLDYLGQRAKDGEAFLTEQAPLVAREIVAWEFWSFSFISVAALLVAIAALVVVSKTVRAFDESPQGPICLLSGIVGVFAFFFATVSGYYAIRAAVAPRLVVLDYVKGISK